MTFYDDAELAAVAALRIAAAEADGHPRSREIHEVTLRLFDQHGSDGLAGLVIALARHLSAAFYVLAKQQGMTVEEFIDEWEMSKLEQHVLDEEEGEWP